MWKIQIMFQEPRHSKKKLQTKILSKSCTHDKKKASLPFFLTHHKKFLMRLYWMSRNVYEFFIVKNSDFKTRTFVVKLKSWQEEKKRKMSSLFFTEIIHHLYTAQLFFGALLMTSFPICTKIEWFSNSTLLLFLMVMEDREHVDQLFWVKFNIFWRLKTWLSVIKMP